MFLRVSALGLLLLAASAAAQLAPLDPKITSGKFVSPLLLLL